MNIKADDRVRLSGDSSDLWINDYNVMVSTEATVIETPVANSKKVLLNIDEIDGDLNVLCFVRRSRVIPIGE